VVAGIVDPARVARNSAAKAGDLLLLTKPLGVGVMTTALKKGLPPPEGYAEVCVLRLLLLLHM
jgi:selenide,water dikinase